MRSISCGGQPCSVESVTEVHTCGLIASRYARSTPGRLSRFASAHARQARNASVWEASLSPSRNRSIFSLVMPAKSYPTLMLKMKPSGSPQPNARVMSLSAYHALMYSSIACGTVSSVDHSQL